MQFGIAQPDDGRVATNSGRSTAGVEVRLDHLSKTFGAVTAVADVCLDIPSGSFVTLLGPSGSGKTTTLNLIAGFLGPTSGEISFDGRPITAVPPHKRDIGMVFQSYALFPHMTVEQNVAYPLRMRERLGAAAMQTRVMEALGLMQLGSYGKRYPRELSGGQQQRVSMARALVSQPRLLLMDEPLGALDKKVREQMQIEIKQIHHQVGSTFIYVTHDQSEALTMSDLVVVMNDSRIVQVGSPREVYEAPTSEFVADFLGGANLLPGRVVAIADGRAEVEVDGAGRLVVPGSGVAVGTRVSVFIRPEEIRASATPHSGEDWQSVRATVRDVTYLGEAFKVTATAGPLSIVLRVPRSDIDVVATGEQIWLRWPRDRSRVLVSIQG